MEEQWPWLEAAEALRQGEWKEAERLAKSGIEAVPLHPQPWVTLGETLWKQKFVMAARRCFQRAWLLDPKASWPGTVFPLLKPEPDDIERFDIEMLLHVPRVSITAAIVVRNAEDTIHRCLESLRGAVDHIVVMDSGSTDRTVELVREFSFRGLRLYKTKWQDSVAQLRNEVLRYIITDWVLWIDADEWLHKSDRSAVREAAGLFQQTGQPCVLNIMQHNRRGVGINPLSVGRMFPMRNKLRFWGRIHEKIGTAEGMHADRLPRSDIRIRLLHDGYEPSSVKKHDKIERNLGLLRMMIEEEPNEPEWRLSLGMDLLSFGFPEQALEALHKAEEAAAGSAGFSGRPDIHRLMGQIHYAMDELDLAERCVRKALDLKPRDSAALRLLAQIHYKRAGQHRKQAVELLRRAKDSIATPGAEAKIESGIHPWRLEVIEADMLLTEGRLAEAEALYLKHAGLYGASAIVSAKLERIAHVRRQLGGKP